MAMALCCNSGNVLGQIKSAAKRDSVYLKVYAEPDADSVRSARYYDQAVAKLQIELSVASYTGGGNRIFTDKKYMKYIPYDDGEGCGCWTAKVDAGNMYRLRYNHPGFKPDERLVDPKADKKVTLFLQSKGGLAKSYGMNPVTMQYEPYQYIPGTLMFSETIIVFFKEGDDLPKPSENQAFLKEKALKDLQKQNPDISVRHVAQLSYAKNAFYVVLGLPDRRTMADLLYFQENGDKPFPRGYYIGNDITLVIETLLKAEGDIVEKVLPTFYEDKEMEYRTVDPDDYPKSKRLQRKLGDVYYEYEFMLDELEKKLGGQ